MATAAGVALFASAASAQQLQPYGARYDRGFGNRDAFVFSVEQVLGFEHLELGSTDNNGSSASHGYDAKPMGPLFWGDVGLFDVSKSGLTLGALLGFTHIFVPDNSQSVPAGGSDDTTIIRIKPRIGYAGAATPTFGYWVRGGPSFFTEFARRENQAYTFAVGAEAYGVITPYPHFGILIGPNFDIHVFGRDHDGNSAKLTEYGLSAGLMGELW